MDRRPFVGELRTIATDDGAAFTIRRCSVRQHTARERVVADARQVHEADRDERDFRVGDLETATVLFGLHGWNLHDEGGHPVPINEETVLAWLSPDEFDAVHEAVLAVNPLWQGVTAVKQGLSDVFEEQLREIDLGVPLSQPAHPYVDLWLHCRRYGNALTGGPCLPESGGYLDQDAECMLAFDILTDIYETLQHEKKSREDNLKNAPAQFMN